MFKWIIFLACALSLTACGTPADTSGAASTGAGASPTADQSMPDQEASPAAPMGREYKGIPGNGGGQ
ncbi:MAG TPA: hypothetical protein VHK70_02485 [Burkholderiaceae bacterium]|jgi:hypothetical protein|nr:hypothetical protein [Burkholderiaceae bacterium]